MAARICSEALLSLSELATALTGSPVARHARRRLSARPILSPLILFGLVSVALYNAYPLHAYITVPSTFRHLQDLHDRVEHLHSEVVGLRAALHLSSLDNVAKPDFALYSAGARDIPRLTSPSLSEAQGMTWPIFGGKKPSNLPWYGASMALYHDTHVGLCWAFSGSRGRIGVQLSQRAYIEEVTVEHAAAELSFDLKSAPRRMRLWGLVEGTANIERVAKWQERGRILGHRKHSNLDVDELPEDVQDLFHSGEWAPLVSMTFDINATSNIQTFPVDEDARLLDVDFGTVMLIIDDNWGSATMTCLYRVRIHGQPAFLGLRDRW